MKAPKIHIQLMLEDIWMDMNRFSYGYYPPNLQTEGRAAPKGFLITRMRPKNPFMREGVSDDSGVISMPLIIPPVRDKKYDFYGESIH